MLNQYENITKLHDDLVSVAKKIKKITNELKVIFSKKYRLDI